MSSTNIFQVQADPAMQALFPLPLSPFERYMVLDDTHDYPMSFVLIVHLEGALDRNVFEESLTSAINRHPLLTSLIRQVDGKGWSWCPLEVPAMQIDWNESSQSLHSPSQEKFDLTREIGLRVGVDCNFSSAKILFQFHHACTDGLGGVQFIGDVLAYYGNKTATEGDELPELEPVEFNRLLQRAVFSTVDSETAPQSVSCPLTLGKRLFKLLRRLPSPLTATKTSDSVGRTLEFPAIVSRVIERSVLQQFKVVAARKSVELNDLYLLEMFQTLRLWNKKHGSDRENQWLRIGMPTSLRTPDHDRMPAANVVSYMFLTRRASDCNAPDKLLTDIHQQTSKIVNNQQGRFVAFGMKYVLKLPGLLRCLLWFNPCFTTAILANVGDIRRQFTAGFPLKRGRCVAGNVTLDALIGAAPVRSNTRLSTSLGTYAGNLYINMHCDPLSFTREQAEELADLYVNQLKQLVPADLIEERAAA